MKKLVFSCLLVSAFLYSYAINKSVIKPFIEGRGLRGWQIDSIQLKDTATFVYGHYGLGKGDYTSGDLNSYIEVPATGKRYKQTGLIGYPMAPGRLIGKGNQETFVYIFQPIDPNTKCINITNDDFDGRDAGWYGVWLCPKTSIFTEQLSKLPALEGNWYSSKGEEGWKAGFYEKKIFWNNDFWDFKVLNVSKMSASLELSNSKGKNTVLKLKMTNDNNLTLSANGEKLQLNKKPVYKIADKTAFNQAFSKQDSITVTGYYQVANPIFSKKAALIVPDILSDKPFIYPINVLADGTFKIKIPLNHVAKVIFSNQLGPMSPLSEVSFIAEPGNDVILSYRNENEDAVVFGGDNERVNNEFQAFSNANPYFVTERKLRDRIREGWESFVSWRKDQFEKVNTCYTFWQTVHPVNVKLNDYMRLYSNYALVSDLAKGAAQTGTKTDKIDFLPLKSDTTFYNNPNALLLPEYSSFLSNLKTLQRYATRPNLSEICSYIQKNAYPTANEIAILQKLESIQKDLDTKEKYDNYKIYVTENKPKIDSIFLKYSLVIVELGNSKKEETQLKFGLLDGFAQDFAMVREFGNLLANGESSLSANQIAALNLKCKNQDLKEQLLLRNTEIETNLEKFKNTKLPEGVNTFTLPEETKDLTSAIAQKYKGKVIYVDFWATWCGPCRGEMPYSEKRKEDFKGKDVVFVYITGASSPEMTWKRMISDMKGEHYKLSENQWKDICDQYKITGIPHYMLLDKTGKIVMEDAPRPSTGMELNQAINKLLE